MENSQDGFALPPMAKFKKLNINSDTSDFYQQYKSLSKIEQMNEMSGEHTAFSSILQHSQKHSLLPSKVGLVGRRYAERVELQHHTMGDKYISVLGQAVRYTPEVRSYSLAGNRIGEMGASALLPNLSHNV